MLVECPSLRLLYDVARSRGFHCVAPRLQVIYDRLIVIFAGREQGPHPHQNRLHLGGNQGRRDSREAGNQVQPHIDVQLLPGKANNTFF